MNLAASAITNTTTDNGIKPVIIIGTGPVGIRIAQKLLRERPDQPIVIYGNEPWEPYNRVQLSSFLAGELDWLGLVDSQRLPEQPNITRIYNCEVVYIDTNQRYVVDAQEQLQHYDKLILATGSRPHVPGIPGIEKKHVYRFRSMSDVQQLSARQARSRTTVILGGGVLGLEAARAMQRQNTEVIIIDHAMHLMNRQLDEPASQLLREQVMKLGIKVQLGRAIKCIEGDDKITGVRLRDDKLIKCDTVIVATGIRSNIELARNAGLSVGRGIKVNDQMQTSDPNIYAAGECVEHRGQVYGLVAPGYEQAGVVVSSLLQQTSDYQGSLNATKLKVVGMPVFSMGMAVIDDDPGQFYREYRYSNSNGDHYRKLVIKHRRLIGAIAIGDWDEQGRVQECITRQGRIWPWQIQRFLRTGQIWSEEQSAQVSHWPASSVVCQCTGVTRGQLSKVMVSGPQTLESLRESTGASSVCGGCKPLLANLLGDSAQLDKLEAYKSVLVMTVLSLLISGLIALLPSISFQDSFANGLNWDQLWRDKLFKQISGYTILGLSVVAVLISLRKRIKAIKWFEFSYWRLVHLGLGLLAIATLIAHTGFRVGENLNFYLMVNFLAILMIGAVAGISMALQHKLDAAKAMSLRKSVLWVHILLVWPLPLLLAFHVLQTYYF